MSFPVSKKRRVFEGIDSNFNSHIGQNSNPSVTESKDFDSYPYFNKPTKDQEVYYPSKSKKDLSSSSLSKKKSGDSSPRPKKKVRYSPNSGLILSSPPSFRPELKICDVFSTHNMFNGDPTSGHIVLLNGLTQGVDRNQRIGRNIRIKGFEIKCLIYYNTGSPTIIEDLLKFFVFYDNQCNGALPTNLSDIYQSYNNANSTSTTGDHFCFQNMNNEQRFKILIEKEVPITTSTLNMLQENSPPKVNFTLSMGDLDLPTSFSGTGNTVSSIVTGSLCFGFWSMNSATGAVVWKLKECMRLFYTDE